MASTALITQPAFGKFLTALTATDVVPDRERRAAAADQRRKLKDEIWLASVATEVAFHCSMAASIAASAGRVVGMTNSHELNRDEEDAVAKLIQITDILMKKPLIGPGDRAKRIKLIRRYRAAIQVPSTIAIWDWWVCRWERELADS